MDDINEEAQVITETEKPDDDLNPESESKSEAVNTTGQEIYDIEKFSGKVFYELREIHKLCQNFYAGRMHVAEQELEKYHEIERGRAFDSILKQVAQIYINNENLPEKIEDEKIKKRVNYILLELLQILEEYGIHSHKSSEGDKPNSLVSIIDYVETFDAEKNGKIAESIQTGFCRENSSIMRELVKLYKAVPKEKENSGKEEN